MFTKDAEPPSSSRAGAYSDWKSRSCASQKLGVVVVVKRGSRIAAADGLIPTSPFYLTPALTVAAFFTSLSSCCPGSSSSEAA